MASVDDILGPEPAKPSPDSILGAPPQPNYLAGMSGPEQDMFIAQSPIGHVLDAFGQGVKQGWGAQQFGLLPETESFLRKAGVFNDYQGGQNTLIKSFNEAIIRPAAGAAELAMRGGTALFTGAQAATSQAFTEVGQERLGRDIAAMPEAFFGSPGALHTPLPQEFAGAAELAKARSLGVVGEGEEGWRGIAEPKPEDTDARAAAVKHDVAAQPEPGPEPQPTPVEAPAPDVHQIARQIAPDTFQEYDALVQRKDTFNRWIDELKETRDQNATADIDKQIAEQQARLETATGKKAATYRDRLQDLQDQRTQALADANKDTPDIQRVRQELMKTDYRMRDLAPDVSAAYREAQARMPQPEIAPEAPRPESHQVPEVEPGVSPNQNQQLSPPPQPSQHGEETTPRPTAPVNITGDISQKLVAAGRPKEEADAAASLVAAHYEARAQRLGTTASELYQKEGPQITTGGKGRKGETGRTIVQDDQTTIRLMGNADASTFLHETGHQWLEEMMRDAQDDRALPDVKADAQTVRDWLGAKEGEDITRAQHEKFARSFERYMMEGRAPSQALAQVFAKFKDWLTQIYQTVAKLRSPITDDIRNVFDRLISAAPERTVIAPDHELPKALGERHTEIAEKTSPENAHIEADKIRAEADEFARLHVPEIADELNAGRPGTEAPGNAPAGGAPDRGGDAGQPVSGRAGGGETVGALGPGGDEAAAPGGGTRTKERSADPAGPNQRFSEPESHLIDKAGNIRLDNLNTTEDVAQVIREAAEQTGDFIGARRGVISDAQVLDMADALGVDASALLKRKLGQAFNAEQIVYARKLLIQSATEVRDLAAKAASGTDADVMAYAKAADRHRMIQAQVSGITAEAGRALRAFRYLEGGKEASGLSAVLQESTGKTLFQLRREAQKAANLSTPAKVSKFALDSAKPGLFDWIQSTFTNALLSGPFTHATYTVAGQMYGLFRGLGEAGAAAVVGKIRNLTGLGPEEHAYAREVTAQLYGQFRGARNGAKAAWDSFKSGDVVLPEEVVKLRDKEISQGLSPSVGQSVAMHGVIPGVAGKILESPSRMVSALHSFNWTTFYSQSISGQAARLALDEGLEGEALAQRIAHLTTSPTDGMIREASSDAAAGALMQRPSPDSLMGTISRLTNMGVKVPDVPLPGGKSFPMGTLRPLKYIDPFVQIQANVMRTAFMRGTPLALFKQSVRDDLMMRNGGAAFDRAAGKIIAGTGLMVMAGGLASEGLLTPSGPSAPNQAREWQRLHGMPHGLTIGDMSYNVLRMGNLGLQMSIAADLYNVAHMIGHDDFASVMGDLMHSFTQNILDESFLRGPSDVLKAVEDRDRYGASYVRNLVSSFTPFSVGLSQVAREIDPSLRQARTTMDAIVAKLPVASETLMPRRDVWGEPIPSRGWALTYRQPIPGDATDDTLYKMGVYPSLPERKIRGVQLTEQQYDDYSRISGRLAKMRLDQIVNQPGFEQIPEAVRVEMVTKTISGAREMARAQVMMQSLNGPHDIVKQAVDTKTAKLKTSSQ